MIARKWKDYQRAKLLRRMQVEWDARARDNASYYVNTERHDWSEEEFFRSGVDLINEEILNDMGNICQGRDPAKMRILEIGCGVGRVTMALADVFGEVHGVDVSGEMIAQARRNLAGKPNVHLYRNNGMDLKVLPEVPFDFAFSCIVFQHIPSYEVIENYMREVHRLLRPGSLFKFQLQGDTLVIRERNNTWVGVPFTDAQVVAMADRSGFEPRHRHGAGTQYFWIWFFRK